MSINNHIDLSNRHLEPGAYVYSVTRSIQLRVQSPTDIPDWDLIVLACLTGEVHNVSLEKR